MNPQISVIEVKDLGDRKFSVRLSLDTKSPEVDLAHTETVKADGLEAAVEIAKASFSRWLEQMLEYAKRHKLVQP